MRDFDNVAAQVHVFLQHLGLGLSFDVRREQKSSGAITNSQHHTIIVAPGRLEVCVWRRPEYFRSDLAEMQDVAGANFLDWQAGVIHRCGEPRILEIVRRIARDDRTAHFEIARHVVKSVDMIGVSMTRD